MVKKNKQVIKKPNRPTILLAVFLGLTIVILPFITNKEALDISLMPRLLVLSIFLIGMTLVMFHKKLFHQWDTSVLRNTVFPTYAAFFLVGVLSLFFALNKTAGFFDTAKTFVFLIYLIYACLLFLSTEEWKRFLIISVIITSLVTLSVGFYEYITELGFGFHSRSRMSNIKGLMSNVNLYANSLLLLVPFVGLGIFTLKGILKKISILVLIGLLFMIFLLQTRATYVGLVAGGLSALVVLLVFSKNFLISSKLRHRVFLISLLVIVSSSLAVATAREGNPYADRIKSIFDDSRDGGRTLIWRITLKMIADHPVTGVGAGNYTINIQEYYGDYDFGNRQTNWLRPHNDFLWVLSEKGIFGIALFLLFFGLGLYYAIAIIRSDTTKENKLFALFAIMGLISYMANSFFDFPLERINQQIYLALYVAGVTTIYHQIKQSEKKPLIINKTAFSFLILLLMALVSVFSYKAIQQEVYMQKTIGLHRAERWEEMLVAVRDAHTPWKTLNPLATPVAFYEGIALAKLNDIPGAIKAFEEAYTQNPNRMYLLNNLANTYLLAQEYEKAAFYAEKSLGIFPRSEETLRILASAYFYQNKISKSLETLERIPEKDMNPAVRSNISHLKRLLRDSLYQ
jgi:O-antigen ligase